MRKIKTRPGRPSLTPPTVGAPGRVDRQTDVGSILQHRNFLQGHTPLPYTSLSSPSPCIPGGHQPGP